MSESRKAVAGYMMWFVASFFYAYQYILRVLPNIMMNDLMQNFQINADHFGQLNGIYYIGYALLQIPFGIMLDRYGPKWVLPVAMVCASLGLLPFIYADIWLYPCLGRFLIGAGSSAAILGIFKVLRMAFAEEKFARMLGMSVTIGLLGAIYGGLPVKWLMDHFGWHQSLHLLIYVGLFLAILTFWILPKTAIETVSTATIWADLKDVFTNRSIMFICLLAGFMVGPLEGFADAWSTSFLIQVHGLPVGMAASLPAIIFVGMCVGAPLLTFVAEKTQKYFTIIAMSGLVMGLGFILLLVEVLPVSVITLIFFIVGILCAYQVLAIYKAGTLAKPSSVGVTTAAANMIIMIFGYLFHTLIGKLMMALWDGKTVANVPVYDSWVYCSALSVIPVTLILAALGFAFYAYSERRPLVSL